METVKYVIVGDKEFDFYLRKALKWLAKDGRIITKANGRHISKLAYLVGVLRELGVVKDYEVEIMNDIILKDKGIISTQTVFITGDVEVSKDVLRNRFSEEKVGEE